MKRNNLALVVLLTLALTLLNIPAMNLSYAEGGGDDNVWECLCSGCLYMSHPGSCDSGVCEIPYIGIDGDCGGGGIAKCEWLGDIIETIYCPMCENNWCLAL